LSIAASPLEFGSFGKIDLASMEFIQGIWRSLASNIAGPRWWKARALIGRG
jgi:hypothetical protein